MRAIILAAGRGSRMGALTRDRPKCLVEFAGKSLLARQMAALGAGGIETIAAVRGYRGDRLEGRGLVLFDNPDWASSNMVMSLARAAAWLGAGPCLVSYADIFYPAAAVAALAAAAGDLVIAYDRDWLSLWRRRFADPLTDAESFRLNGGGRVLEIGRRAKSLAEIEGQYMGLLKFTPAGWRAVEAALGDLDDAGRRRLDMTGLLDRLIGRGQSVMAVAVAGPWGEVDSESDLALYESMAAAGALPSL